MKDIRPFVFHNKKNIMRKSKLLKTLTILGIVLLNFNAWAGTPETGSIIIFQTESQLKFKVEDQNQNTISEVVYFKLDASSQIVKLSADNCGQNFCNYSFRTENLVRGLYQVQVYVVGYNEPITKSFTL